MKRILREPLLHFILIGAVLFIITAWVNTKTSETGKQIIVDNNTIARMVMQYQSQFGTLPSKEALDGMIEDHIKEEIYYREALRLGLDKDDEIIRRRLSQKYEFLQDDLTVLPTPSDETLKKFYDAHPELFRDSGTVSFMHIYFSPDNGGNDKARRRAESVFEKISSTGIEHASQIGDPFPLENSYSDITMLDARQNFGVSAFADSLFTIPEHRWSQPVQSGYGWHLIYVEDRKPAIVPPFGSVKQDVTLAWQNEQRKEQNEKKYHDIQSHYSISREYLKGK